MSCLASRRTGRHRACSGLPAHTAESVGQATEGPLSARPADVGSRPRAPVREHRANDRSRSVTDVGFVGHRTEKGRLPPTNSARSWRPETGRPEIERRGFSTTRRSAADQFELRLLSQSHGLNPSVPRLGGIGDPCRTRHRRPGSVVFADPYCPATANNAFERCRSFCTICVASGTVPIVNTSLLRTGDRNLCLDIALEWRFARRESDDCPFEACPGAGSAPRAQRGNRPRCGSRAGAAARRSAGAGTSAVARRNAGRRDSVSHPGRGGRGPKC